MEACPRARGSTARRCAPSRRSAPAPPWSLRRVTASWPAATPGPDEGTSPRPPAWLCRPSSGRAARRRCCSPASTGPWSATTRRCRCASGSSSPGCWRRRTRRRACAVLRELAVDRLPVIGPILRVFRDAAGGVPRSPRRGRITERRRAADTEALVASFGRTCARGCTSTRRSTSSGRSSPPTPPTASSATPAGPSSGTPTGSSTRSTGCSCVTVSRRRAGPVRRPGTAAARPAGRPRR